MPCRYNKVLLLQTPRLLVTERLAADIQTNLYPWLSRGKMTSRVTAPWPLSAEYSLSDCIGKVPVLLSSAP